MADFGKHRYYRITVDAAAGAFTYWTLTNMLPSTHNTQGLPPIEVEYDGIDYAPLVWVSENTLVLTNPMTRVSNNGGVLSAQTYDADVQINQTWITSTDLLPFGINVVFSFEEAVYVPVWYFSNGGDKISGMTLHYSDTGTNWVLVGSVTGTPLFPEDDRLYEVMFGDNAIYKGMISRASLPAEKVVETTLRGVQNIQNIYLPKSLSSTHTLASGNSDALKSSLAWMQWRLSGGVANTDPALSLGGGLSGTQIFGQSYVAKEEISGISILSGGNNERGLGTLSVLVYPDSVWLDWNPSGIPAGGFVNISASGVYTAITHNGTEEGYLCVSVDADSLPTEDTSTHVFVENTPQEVMPDIESPDSEAGSTVYRCLYLINTSTTGSTRELELYIKDTYSGDDIAIGIDPAGVESVAEEIADENTAPAGVVFHRPTKSNPIEVGSLVGVRFIAVWVRRVVGANSTKKTLNDLSIIEYKAKFT